MAYKKQRADAFRIAPLPKTTYDTLNGIESETNQILILSWLLGGAVVTKPKKVDTPKGIVEIGMGEVWGSTHSIAEDIYAAVGHRLTSRQISYAISKAEKNGMVVDLGLVNPSTRGKYGKKYRVNDEIIYSTESEYINVVKAYTMFFYGNPADFDSGEIVTGKNIGEGDVLRGKYGNVQGWLEYVAKHGSRKEAFTTIGRWRSGEEADATAPVLVPWITIDIDRFNILDAHKDASRIVEELYDRGFDLNRVFVSYSGRRGFHVQISTDQIGSPIFADAFAAQETMKEIMADITEEWDIEYDPSTCSPLKLIRLTGSIHGETGNYKRTWIASEFMALSHQEIFSNLSEHRAFDLPSPLMGKVEHEVLERFYDAVGRAQSKLKKVAGKRKENNNGVGPVIGRILKGIGESEVWHEYHSGRNKASFILSCWLHENPKFDEAEAWEYLKTWNRKNTPPLRDRELKRTFDSGRRTVNKGK